MAQRSPTGPVCPPKVSEHGLDAMIGSTGLGRPFAGHRDRSMKPDSSNGRMSGLYPEDGGPNPSFGLSLK